MIAGIEGRVGKAVTLSGYAQDFGVAIVAMQFSANGGESWSSYQLHNIDAERNLNWTYSFTPELAGNYQILIRAVSSDGRVTPEPAIATIHVTE
jgi:hypothetical protein